MISFVEAGFKRRIERSPREKDLLRDALGAKQGRENFKVLDCTAGLCRDALRVAYWGHEVWACEREPSLADDLLRAYIAAMDDPFYAPWIARLKIAPQSTEEFLAEWSGPRFDVAIIDPMFPEIRRKSLPQKDLQLLKARVRPDDNAVDLLDLCWKYKPSKIILKRPLKSPALGPRKPTHSYKGRAHRWDVYVNPA